MKLLGLLLLVVLMLLFFGLVLWYILLPLIPPQNGPLHWVLVSTVVLGGIGLGMLGRPRPTDRR